MLPRFVLRAYRVRRARSVLSVTAPPFRLHLGCGAVYIKGWVNVDIARSAVVDFRWDLGDRLPIRDNTCEAVFHEHVLEHLPAEAGVKLLRECRRVLKPGGVLRVAMPSLEKVVERYNGQWREQAWLQSEEYAFIKTRAEMLNVAFRWWGHQWLYDHEELDRRLAEAGFLSSRPQDWGKSAVPELCGLEGRPDSLLIREAVK